VICTTGTLPATHVATGPEVCDDERRPRASADRSDEEVDVSDELESNTDAIDFAVAAYRDDGEWVVTGLPAEGVGNLEELLTSLRRFPGETGILGFVSVDEDFFLLVRVAGARARLLLSDVTAADDWPLARQVVEELGIDLDELDPDNPEPAGDLGLFADLGLDPRQLAAICDDVDAFPDELLDDIATELGFADAFREAADAVAG
jgi:putative tRNA adenosine deaminase-associated protein